MIHPHRMSRQQLTLTASREALKVRATHGIGLQDPVCVFDIAEQMGIEVRFIDQIPRLEGFYVGEGNPHILVPSHRPPGRQAFTCAHELGHHVFGHGHHINTLSTADDPFSSGRMEPEEFLANQFAAFLLMPKTALLSAFTRRGWSPTASGAVQIYTVAGWLGVGYTTLISHMCYNLRLLSQLLATQLSKMTPKRLRAEVLGRSEDNHLIIADVHWTKRAIDVQVGDVIALPPGTMCEAKGQVVLVEQDTRKALYRAVQPGRERFSHQDSGWATYVRVSRRNFAGRSKFRHLEEAEDE